MAARGAGALLTRPAPIAPHVRLALLGGLLIGELALIAACFDAAPILIESHGWWARLIAHTRFVMPLVTAVVTATVLLAGTRLRTELASSAATVREHRAWPWLAAHVVAFAVFFGLTSIVFGSPRGGPVSGWWAALWALTGVAQCAALAPAALPVPALVTFARRALAVLLACVAVGAAAWAAGQVTEEWWYPLGRSTLWLVSLLLPLVVSDAVVVPDTRVVGTPTFQIEIAPRCAGYEGIGLIWVFLAVYLWTFRRTLRFPHALLLLPIGTAIMWLVNALRITGLVWIGTAWSPEVALGGFHANSGSLLLCIVALGIGWAAHRSTFLTRRDAAPVADDEPTPVAAYLVPFLLGIVATMVSGLAGHDAFDAFYGLRVVAAGAALWLFRRDYPLARASWSPAAMGVPAAAGVAVALAWIVSAEPAAEPDATAAALAALPTVAAAAWIAIRMIGAVVTVPLAEELAFRGYLARRLVAREFERVPFERLTPAAILVSSVLFGALHGRFVAAVLAGAVYALVARRRGALADAVVAHAVTNALLGAWVVATGRWSAW
jgi:exosortase E/protease (VPEID-CTERM system)